MCLCETKTNYISPDEFPNFDIFNFQHKTVEKSLNVIDVSILVNKKLKKKVNYVDCNIIFECNNIVWLTVGNNDIVEFILGAVYLPCQTSRYFDKQIFDKISLDMLSLNSKYDVPFILIGDFNARTGNLSDFCPVNDNDILDNQDIFQFLDIDFTRSNKDKVTNLNGTGLIDLCKSFNLIICNGRIGEDKAVGDFTCQTPNGNSLVDYIIVSTELLPHVSNFRISEFDRCLSDVHRPIHMTLEVCNLAETDKGEITEDYGISQVLYRKMWNTELSGQFFNSFDNNLLNDFGEKIENFREQNLTQDNMDSFYKELSDLFIDRAKSVGLCKNTKNTKPNIRKYPKKEWFTQKCEEKRKQYMEMKNELRRIQDFNEKIEFEKKVQQNCNFYRKFIKKEKQTYLKNLHETIRSVKKRDPKEYCKILYGKNKGKKMGNVTLRTFKEHFQALNQAENGEDTFDPRILNLSENVEINKPFTLSEIKQVIKKLKNEKACGIDNIKNEYLKNCPDNVVNIIVDLFNLVLKTGIIPTDWCLGIINPLFKKGSPHNVDNYRGITLLSCLGKLYTSCLYHRASDYLNAVGSLGEEQAGFREGYSPTNHVFVLNSLVELYSQKKKIKLFCAFVDYSKAFDKIKRTALWRKLINPQHSINGPFLTSIYNLYENAKSCVRKNGKLSENFACNVGVRQGENLSPLLFAIYLNDFEKYLKDNYSGLTLVGEEADRMLSDENIEVFIRLYILLYADDTVIMAESPNELQRGLNALSQYCEDWSLQVNMSKTKIVIFSKGKSKKPPVLSDFGGQKGFKFRNDQVEIVDEYVYLGVTFNFNGSHFKAMKKQIDQARKAMFSLLTKARRLCLPVDLQLELFHKTVLPILLYGCEVWGHKNVTEIEVFYRKFLKIILKLQKDTPNCMVYGETGTTPLRLLIDRRLISFWMKISEGKETKLSYIIYKLILKLHQADYNFGWIEYIKNILEKCNLLDLWENQEQYESKIHFKSQIFRDLEFLQLCQWETDVYNHRRCKCYRMFKDNFSTFMFENYLNLNFFQRMSLTKFRCGSNRLPVHAHRYSLNDADKICPLCDTGDIGDEYHYIFLCKYFNRDRITFIDSYFYIRPNTLKFKELFQTENIETQIKLVQFVVKIMQTFKSI